MYSMSTINSKKLSIFMSICFVIGLLFASAATAQAATFTVTNTNDSGEGSLRDSINQANAASSDDVITFDPAIFAAHETITLAGTELTILNNGSLAINGPAAGVTISGNDQSRVILIREGANATMSDLTITGGNGVGATFWDVSIRVGGGILNYRGTLTLINSTVSGNSTPTGGGGIFSHRGTMIVSDSTISNNSAVTSGAGINHSSGPLTLSNSTISNNSARFGGGIFTGIATVTITNSTVSGNLAEQGGGIYSIFSSTSTTLTNSTVSGNSATFAGGIFNRTGSTVTLTNSTISGNSAAESGGGILNYEGGTASLINTTASNNSAQFGGGIYNGGSNANLNNSIIANSTSGGDCLADDNAVVNAEYSLFEEGLGCVNGTNVNNLTGDPMLGPLQDNGGLTFTHALLPGSPAFNAGSNLLIPAGVATDQRGTGFPRIGGGTVDIGAFEIVICPRPQGYWKNNPDAWPVESLMLGEEVYTKAELLAILNTPAGTGRNADASVIFAYQLIAAKLNIANGADASSVVGTIGEADDLLNGLGGRLPLKVRSPSANGQLMLGYGSTLDAFNKATTTASCTQ
jgi:hypothetical protein